MNTNQEASTDKQNLLTAVATDCGNCNGDDGSELFADEKRFERSGNTSEEICKIPVLTFRWPSSDILDLFLSTFKQDF